MLTTRGRAKGLDFLDVPEIGYEYVYKADSNAQVERVRVLAIVSQKTGFRAVVEHTGRKRAGEIETVPGKRLKVPWSRKAEFQSAEKVWDRFREVELTEIEERLAYEFFEEFIPSTIARVVVGAGHPHGPQLHPVAQIDDLDALAEVVGVPGADFLKQADWAEVYGELMLSPLGVVQLCQAACLHNPEPVLDYVLAGERRAQHESKYGEPQFVSGRGRDLRSADEVYDHYLRYDRPKFELLRQWCGHRAASVQERLVAAEAEVRRLDRLLVETTEQLRVLDPSNNWVDKIVREHVADVITPESVRPVVERPLGQMDVAQPPKRRFRRTWH